jgi:putative membrane protein
MTWLRALASAAGVALLGWLVWEIGPGALWAQFRVLSWWLPMLLLPYALPAILDAAGWRYAFPGRLPSLPLLVAVRLAGEAVNVTTPTATLGGEPVKAWLLTRARVPLEDGLTSVVVAKTALVVSHLAFLALALVLAAWQMPRGSGLLGVMAVITGAGVVAVGGFVWAQQHGLFGASSRVLGWLGLGPAVAIHLNRLDGQLRAFYRDHRGRFGLSLCFHFLGWVAGSVEVWVALAVLGPPVGFGTAVIIEAFVSAIRSATFLVPASVGAQEGGFVGIFVAFGLGAETGLTFGLIRRLREVAWAVLGYAFLVAWRGRPDGTSERNPAR